MSGWRRWWVAEARNQGDALIYRTRKALSEYGGTLDAAGKATIEAAITELEAALKGSDRDEIDAKVHALATASQQLGGKVYPDVQSQGSSPDAATGPQGSRGAGQDEDVIDADFREVKGKQ